MVMNKTCSVPYHDYMRTDWGQVVLQEAALVLFPPLLQMHAH